MAKKNPLSKFLGTRVTEETRETFQAKALEFGVPADVLREIVIAFNEGRLRIVESPVTSKWKELTYVPRSED